MRTLVNNPSWFYLWLMAAAGVCAALLLLWYILRINRRLQHLLKQERRANLLQHHRSQVLGLLVEQAPLQHVLDALVEGAEQLDPTAICTVLLTDDDLYLHVASAHGLPQEYNQALEGIQAAYGVGSCGTAAATGQRVIVSDVQTDPLWSPYQDLVQLAGIGACWSEPIKDRSGKVLGTFAIYHRSKSSPSPADIQLIQESATLAEIAIERSRALENLKRSEERHRLLADNATDLIWTMDPQGQLTYISPSATKLTGFSPQEMNRAGLEQLLTTASYHKVRFQLSKAMKAVANGLPYPDFSGELEQRCKDGSTIWLEVKTSGMYDASGHFVGILGVSRDLTERRKIEQKMRYMAQHDSLTDLPNRSLFADRFATALQYAERQQKMLALLLLDLNQFKPVNDNFGHAIGDLLLQQVAQRLRQTVRSSDTVARIGGDEFIILLPQVEQAEQVRLVADKITEQLNQHFVIQELQIHISCAIGVALYPHDGRSDLELTKVADQRMYQHKQEQAETDVS